ncbi:MAG: pyruvate kinase [Cyclobacteriaceae bacterium]|jgi:pyruvate kinase
MIETFQKRSKIVATVGPASNNKETLIELIKAGANVFRLNFSHGTHEDHQKVIELVSQINIELGTHIALLQDLQGPKIRVNKVENDAVEIEVGNPLVITTDELVGTAERVSTSYKGIVNDVATGDSILIDDGNLELRVIKVDGKEVHTEVVHGGILKSRKGINLPNTNVSAPSLTPKDEEDLEFGLQFDLEWVALSFVRKASDITELREKIVAAGKNTKIVAKIEKPEAIDNIDEIIAVTDAIMVARGDLGVEIPMHDVPILQKQIARKCNIAGKPVIIATQMMESMIENPRPTRAETNDVANAVMDGADALMLSAESASGKYPVHAVRRMSQTISAVETQSESIYHKFYDEDFESVNQLNDLLVRAACKLGEFVNARALVGMTKSGYTGFQLSKHRPKSEIYIFTNQKHLLRQLNLVWGVKSFYYDKTENIDDTLDHIQHILEEKNLLEKGDIFINTASMPSHWSGHTNMMKVHQVE